MHSQIGLPPLVKVRHDYNPNWGDERGQPRKKQAISMEEQRYIIIQPHRSLLWYQSIS